MAEILKNEAGADHQLNKVVREVNSDLKVSTARDELQQSVRKEQVQRPAKVNLLELTRKLESAVYQQTVLQQMGQTERELDSQNKKVKEARRDLTGLISEQERMQLEQNAMQAGFSRSQRIKQIHDRIKDGVANGWDLALLLQQLSQSDFQLLSEYFRENGNGEHIWQFTERNFSCNKEKGREAHAGKCCIAAEYQPAGLAESNIEVQFQSSLSDPGKSKEQKLEICKLRITEIARQSAESIVDSASSDLKSDFVRNAETVRDNLQKYSDQICSLAEADGIESSELKELQDNVFSSTIAEAIIINVKDSALQKGLEVQFFNQTDETEVKSSEAYWDKKHEDFLDNLRAVNFYNQEIDQALQIQDIREDAENSGKERGKELKIKVYNFHTSTEFSWQNGGTDEAGIFNALEGCSAAEKSLMNKLSKKLYGRTIHEEIISEMEGDDRYRALALLNDNGLMILSLNLNEELGRWHGRDQQKRAALYGQYEKLSTREQQKVDLALRKLGLLEKGQTLAGYTQSEMSKADAIFAKSQLQKGNSSESDIAITLAGLFHEKRGDYSAVGKILESALVRKEFSGNPPELKISMNTALAKQIRQQVKDMYGYDPVKRVDGSKYGQKWVASLLQGKDVAEIEAYKYAHASEINDQDLATSVLNDEQVLKTILSIEDEQLRFKLVACYQKEYSQHLDNVNSKSLQYCNGKTLSQLNERRASRADSRMILTENGRILAEYRSYHSRDPKTLSLQQFEILQSVSRTHKALHIKLDEQAALSELMGRSNQWLETFQNEFTRITKNDLRRDLEKLKKPATEYGKWLLDGDPIDKGDRLAYLRAIYVRNEQRLQIEDKGLNFAKAELKRIKTTHFIMKTELEFLEKNWLNLSEEEKNSREKKFFRNNIDFRGSAEHHNQIKREKAEFWCNVSTMALVIGVSILTFNAGLLVMAAWTAGVGLGGRIVTKGVIYGFSSYDWNDDLNEDLTDSARDAGLAVVGGAVFKGLGAARLRFKLARMDRICGVAQRAGKSHVAINQGSNLVPTAYKYVAEALESAKKVAVNQRTDISIAKLHKLFKSEIKTLRSAGALTRKEAREFMSGFMAVNEAYLRQHLKHNLSIWGKLRLGLQKKVIDTAEASLAGAVTGAAYQGMSSDTYSNGREYMKQQFFRSVMSGGMFGGALGLGFSTVGTTWNGLVKGTKRTLGIRGNEEIVSAEELRKVFRNPAYDQAKLAQEIAKLKIDGNLHHGNFRLARHQSRLASDWNPINLYCKWRINCVNKLHGGISEGDLKLFAEYDRIVQRGYLKGWGITDVFSLPTLWWKVCIRRNFNLTDHQIEVAKSLNGKNRLSKFDVMNFRRSSALDELTPADIYSEKYGFYVTTDQAIEAVNPHLQRQGVRLNGRNQIIWPMSVAICKRAWNEFNKYEIHAPRLFPPKPQHNQNINAADFISNALTFLNPKIITTSLMFALSGTAQAKVTQAIVDDVVRITPVAEKVIVGVSDDIRAVKISENSSNQGKIKLNEDQAKKHNIKKKGSLKKDETETDRFDINRLGIRHSADISEQQRIIQQQLSIRAMQTESSTDKQEFKERTVSRKNYKKSSKRGDNPDWFWLPEGASDDEKKKNEEQEYDLLVQERAKRQSKEFDESVNRGLEWHSRAIRKVFITDEYGKKKLAVQRMRDDFQWETLSVRDIVDYAEYLQLSKDKA